MVLVALVLILRDEIVPFAAYYPLLGLIAVGGLWSKCLHCYVGGTTISAFAPLAEVVYLLGGAVLFTLTLSSKRVLYVGFLIVSLLVPVAQSYLLATEPKLCPACLMVTFLSAAYFAAALHSVLLGRVTGVAAPSFIRLFTVCGLVVMLVRHTLMLGGY